MIIVKTSNGDHFVNEAEVLQVAHNKAKSQVVIWPSRWCDPTFVTDHFVIEDVKSIIYHPDKWKDQYSWSDDLQSKYISMYDDYIGMQNEIARLKEKLRDFGCEL